MAEADGGRSGDPPRWEVGRAALADLDALIGLYRASFPAARRRPVQEVERKFRALFFDGPFASAEVPSLVARDADGLIVGFRGWLLRRWCLGEEPLAGRTENSQMVRADARRRGVMSAIQEHGREIVARQGADWFAFSGDASTGEGLGFNIGTHRKELHEFYLQQYGFGWEIVLRPLRLGATRGFVRRLRLPGLAGERLAQGAAAILPRAAGAAHGGEPLRAAPLSGQALAECHAALGADYPLRLDESVESWLWLLEYMADYPSRGRFHGRVFLSASREPIGFYAGYLRPDGRFDVLGLGVLRDRLPDAFDQLLRDAAAIGAQRAAGRAAALQLRTLIARGASISAGLHVRINSPRPDIRLEFESMQALISGLEGERWT